jgi:hypothetical protein
VRRPQPPIGSYPSWLDKNPIRRTSADETAVRTEEEPVALKRGGRAKPMTKMKKR